MLNGPDELRFSSAAYFFSAIEVFAGGFSAVGLLVGLFLEILGRFPPGARQQIDRESDRNGHISGGVFGKTPKLIADDLTGLPKRGAPEPPSAVLASCTIRRASRSVIAPWVVSGTIFLDCARKFIRFCRRIAEPGVYRLGLRRRQPSPAAGRGRSDNPSSRPFCRRRPNPSRFRAAERAYPES